MATPETAGGGKKKRRTCGVIPPSANKERKNSKKQREKALRLPSRVVMDAPGRVEQLEISFKLSTRRGN